MSDVEIRFEREGIEGIVAVGTSLIDAARRFGIRFEGCKPAQADHSCFLIVSSGTAMLSPLTETETEHFAAKGRSSNERLACEAKIISPGEIVIMTEQKTERPTNTKDPKVGFQEEFNSLPLDKKFANLLQMEVATLSETFTYVANSSLKVIEKFGDVISDFGTKVEEEAKKTTESNYTKPVEKKPNASTAPPKRAAKPKSTRPQDPKG